MNFKVQLFSPLLAGAILLTLSACANTGEKQKYKVYRNGVLYESEEAAQNNTLFGSAGSTLFSGDDEEEETGSSGIGVNSFLWRASLDTLSFMPLASADPFGGVIITDWFAPPASPLERFKITVYILDRKLRADGLKVAVFRQSRPAPTAGWSDANVSKSTPTDLENAILTRARQLRVSSVQKSQ